MIKEINILELGAVANGKFNNQKIIQEAIDLANANKNGGKVIIPKGFYLTSPLELKSNVELHLEDGSFLLFTKNKEDYPLIFTNWEGEDRIRTVSPIHAYKQNNIKITGHGTIDGNGHLWRPIKKFKVTEKKWEELLKQSNTVYGEDDLAIWFPNPSIKEEYLNGEVKVDDENALSKASEHYDYYRPSLIFIKECSNVEFDSFTSMNSGAWNIHFLLSEHVKIKHVQIKNPYWAQNGDGLDIESCAHVEVDSCVLDVGDDGLCLKSGKGAKARSLKKPSYDIYIHDCVVNQAHGGFVIGSETSCGINNVRVSNCHFIGTDVGLRFKSALGRGGIMENIEIDHIYMSEIKEDAIIFNLGYVLHNFNKLAEVEQNEYSLEEIPVFQNISMSNIHCLSSNCYLKVIGIEQSKITNITISDSSFKTKNNYHVVYANNIILKNVQVFNETTDDNQSIDLFTINN